MKPTKPVAIDDDQRRILAIIRVLRQSYPQAGCSLRYRNILELTVATMLSAQCTDARVNIVTRNLFKKYKTLQDYAQADIHVLEQDIRSTGFYHNKAKNIKAMAQMVLTDFGGKFPKNVKQMSTLPGIGRKTASAVLGEFYGIKEGIAVDTHMIRLFNLLGFVSSQNALIIERQLMELIPKRHWVLITHLIIEHGRAVCIARRPRCSVCKISKYCPSRKI